MPYMSYATLRGALPEYGGFKTALITSELEVMITGRSRTARYRTKSELEKGTFDLCAAHAYITGIVLPRRRTLASLHAVRQGAVAAVTEHLVAACRVLQLSCPKSI